MKKYLIGVTIVFLIGCATDTKQVEKVTLESYMDSVGYAIGMDIGNTFSTRNIEVDVESFQAGFGDVYNGEETLFSDSLAFAINRGYQMAWQAKQQTQSQELAKVNKAAGELFLNENKKNEDVTVLPSGLQYKVLTAGTGDSPPAGGTVLVKYEGRLVDGTIFDSSYNNPEPVKLSLKQVIKGWQEAIPRMKVGDEWELYIPSELGYGPRGSGGVIGPNEALIFKVKLEGIDN